MLEPQCLLGVPLDNCKLTEEIINGVASFYDKEIASKCDFLIDMVRTTINIDIQSEIWI